MIVIGLTGNMGTGKSTVAGILGALGAAHIDADKIGHELLLARGPVYAAVLSAFGKDITGNDGHIDRQRLGKLVFSDPSAREKLDRITHPAIREEAKRRLAAYKTKGAKVVVLEAALFYEAGWETLIDEVWVAYASQETSVDRVKKYRGMSEDDALSRLQTQRPMWEKMEKADVVIDTDCSLEELKERIKSLWEQRITPSF